MSMIEERRRALATLAEGSAKALAAALEGLEMPPFTLLRPPEIGLVMVRGRMGGTGRRFNLGEMTVTRCAVEAEGMVGHGYVRGRDPPKAELVARCDALIQLPRYRTALLERVVEPLARTVAAERAAAARRAAATKVEFFTLVRGDE